MRSLYGDGSTAIRRERKRIRAAYSAGRAGMEKSEINQYGQESWWSDGGGKVPTGKRLKKLNKQEKSALSKVTMVDKKSVNQVAKKTAAKKSPAKKTVARKKK